MNEHAPLPWAYAGRGVILDAKGRTVCFLSARLNSPDAEKIGPALVAAVNATESHDDKRSR
jgi:hypothetical protein